MDGICLHNFYLLYVLLSYSYYSDLVQQVQFKFYSIYVKISRSAKLNYQKSQDGFAVAFYLVSEGQQSMGTGCTTNMEIMTAATCKIESSENAPIRTRIRCPVLLSCQACLNTIVTMIININRLLLLENICTDSHESPQSNAPKESIREVQYTCTFQFVLWQIYVETQLES